MSVERARSEGVWRFRRRPKTPAAFSLCDKMLLSAWSLQLFRGMATTPNCPLCGNPASALYVRSPSGEVTTWVYYECATCGGFEMTYMLKNALWPDPPRKSGFAEQDRQALSAATRHAFDHDDVLRIATDNVRKIIESVPKPSKVEQANLVLDYIARNEGESRKSVRVFGPKDYPIAYTSPKGLQFITGSLERDGLIKRVDKSAEPHYLVEMKGHERLEEWRRERRMGFGLTGWARVDDELALAQRQLAEATAEADFQAVGHRCREIILSVAQAAFDAAKHSAPGVSPGDAKGLLSAFFGAELKGKDNEAIRGYAKKAEAYASSVAHDRTPTFREAALAVHAARSIAEMVSIVAGRRDPSAPASS